MSTEADQPFSPFVGELVTQMFKDSAFTANALVDGLNAQLLDRDAELYAIRTEIEYLFAAPYMPNPDAIRQAVFNPSKRLFDEYKASRAAER